MKKLLLIAVVAGGLMVEGTTRSDNGGIARYRLLCGGGLSRRGLFGRHRIQK